MRGLGCLATVAVVFLLGGCVTAHKSSFVEGAGQKVIVRSGSEAVLSVRASTQLVVAPATRQQVGPRLSYVAMMRNTGRSPVTFRASDITVTREDSGKPMKVWSVDELQSEARGRAVAAAIFGGIAGAASGHYSGYGSVNGHSFSYSGYNSGIASMNANANIASAMESGEIDVANLEGSVLQDNTILPGEVFGGVFVFDAGPASPKLEPIKYSANVKIGNDVHKLKIVVTGEKIR